MTTPTEAYEQVKADLQELLETTPVMQRKHFDRLLALLPALKPPAQQPVQPDEWRTARALVDFLDARGIAVGLGHMTDAVNSLPMRESGWQPMNTAPRDGTEIIIFIRHQLKTKSFLGKDEEQVWKDCPLTYTAKWDNKDEAFTVYKNPGAPYGFTIKDPEDIDGWIPLPTTDIEGEAP